MTRLAWPLLLFIGACGKDADDRESPDAPLCIDDDPQKPAVEPLMRLAADDYVRTLRVVFGSAAIDDLDNLVAGIPADAAEAEAEFARQDQRISQRHVDQYYVIADALARRTVADGATRLTAGGACGDDIDEACLDEFTPTFLRRALRRPAKAEELTTAEGLVSEFGPEDGLHAIVFTTLMKPEVLYHFETEGSVDGNVVTLTTYEFAARLAYHFWGEPPDDALLQAAESGHLGTLDGLRAQVDRLADDPRTERTLDDFFEGWLHLDRGSFIDSPRLAALAPELETDGLAEAMRHEVEDLLRAAITSHDQTWYDVLTTRDSFAQDPRLAEIYGVPAWDGQGVPPQLDPARRSGLLTRAGLLVTSDGSTNPFRRGAFLRRLVLCQGIPAPPADLPPDALTPPDPSPGATTREAFEAKVQSSECAGCHIQFSPLGYAMETFDGLGRFRAEEHLVTSEGDVFGYAPIDDTVSTAVDVGNETIDGAVDLSDRIAESRSAHRCLSRQYFRYAYRRSETASDTCTIERWTDDVAQGRPLREWLREVALDPRFRQRVLED